MGDELRAAILGVIEGLTEFLPVSSTGHMIIAMPWMGIHGEQDPWPAFLYFIQIGAIAAVVVHFSRRLWRQTFAKPVGGLHNHLILKLVVGVLPAAAIGIPLNEWAETHLEKPVPVAIALILGAAVMVIIERAFRRQTGPKIEEVTLRHAFLIGLAQCVSIIPGTSRAMATIMGGLLVGLPATTAVEFSFYLAIPTICGAGLYRLLKDPQALAGGHVMVLGIGFAISFVVAWGVIAAFMRYIQTRSLQPFAIYRVVLGLVVLGWWLLG
ncbi:MAG: undecaprenyl-diphosphate phosphatase [Phycisphaerae bacterium]|nr:undecaprenyl-diphosphate phosphatase [Phycisphaerae bacterium]